MWGSGRKAGSQSLQLPRARVSAEALQQIVDGGHPGCCLLGLGPKFDVPDSSARSSSETIFARPRLSAISAAKSHAVSFSNVPAPQAPIATFLNLAGIVASGRTSRLTGKWRC